jgi:hypothetical protein
MFARHVSAVDEPVGLVQAGNGLTPHAIASLHEAHRLIYRAHMTSEHASVILQSHGHHCPEVESLLAFIESQHLGKHGRARDRGRTR